MLDRINQHRKQNRISPQAGHATHYERDGLACACSDCSGSQTPFRKYRIGTRGLAVVRSTRQHNPCNGNTHPLCSTGSMKTCWKPKTRHNRRSSDPLARRRQGGPLFLFLLLCPSHDAAVFVLVLCVLSWKKQPSFGHDNDDDDNCCCLDCAVVITVTAGRNASADEANNKTKRGTIIVAS